jgi:signal transduction histidine kinase
LIINRSSLSWRIGSRLAFALVGVTILGVAGLVWHTHSIEANHGHHGLVHDVIREFFLDLAWGIPLFIAAIIAFGAWIVRRAMAPLNLVAEAAQAIGPARPDARLPTEGVPSEVRPVVEATNAALDRLQDAYDLQKRFIANAAHELRTPIATFRAAVERLPDGEGKAALLGDVTRLGRLTGQLLDLARSERPGQLSDIDAVPIIKDVAIQLAPLAASKGITIAIDLQNSHILYAATEPLHVIMRNLIDNALSHAPGGSEVRIGNRDAALTVEDWGPGVPAEMREAIFERFFRGVWSSGNGSGLGLAIAVESARQINAQLSVESNTPTGARFVLSFACF